MKKRILSILFVEISLLLLSVFIPNYIIKKNASDKIYTDVKSIKKNKVGLLLGTSKLLASGRINLYYQFRVDAAVALYKAGKIDFILVSGDNSTVDNDEPTDFKNDLMKNGVPEEKIFLDYAGFRTLDSVVRAKEIFGQSKITIISQKFHNERDIYLAEKYDISAVGFNAKDVSGRYGFKVQLREYLARTKVFVDLVFGVKPKFLGKKIVID
jgi:SanA protein